MGMTTLQAIRKSIRHWVIDIKLPLLRGGKVKSDSFSGDFTWNNTEKLLPIGVRECALCSLFFNQSCRPCPLQREGYGCCDWSGSPYKNFTDKPCLKTANAMIDALIKVYRIEKKWKEKQDGVDND